MKIERISVNDALAQTHDIDSPLVKLIGAGYELSEKYQRHPDEATVLEYDYPPQETHIYLVTEEKIVLGSLTMVIWSTDDPEHSFWSELERLDHTLADKARKISHVACYVGGIVIHPNSRGQDLGRALYTAAITDLAPAFILGQTKVPAAVVVRSRLEEFNYRTFFGNSEITPSRPQATTNIHQNIAYAFLKEMKIPSLLREGFFYNSPESSLAHKTPQIDGFSPIIQTAFTPLLSAQARLSKEDSVLSPLLSIREEILA